MFRTALALTFLFLVTLVTWAQNPRPKLPGEDWVSLFNGKDLTGWVKVGNEKWEVENGTIHGQGITKEYGYLRTEQTYKDFHLSLRFKCEADGNSGVFFHSDFKPGTADVSKGLQFEIDRVVGHHSGGIYGDGRAWIVWPAPENELVIRPDDWNEFLLEGGGEPLRVPLEWCAQWWTSRIPHPSPLTATSPCSFIPAGWETCASRISTFAI